MRLCSDCFDLFISSLIFIYESARFFRQLSILQGFTDEVSTQFTVDVPKILKVHYQVLDPATGKIIEPTSVEKNTSKFSFYKVHKVIFTDLYLNAGFILIVRDDKNNIVDQREFGTLDTNKNNIRIAMLSCMLDVSPHKNEMWKLVEAAQPEMLFLLGDNVYGDINGAIHGPNFLWARYLFTRRALRLYRRKKLIPCIAIWDDHDYGKNNSDGTYKYKEQSLKIFKSFFAQNPISPNYKCGPGVSSSFTAFGQKFIFLDDRFWRQLPNSIDAVGYLGDEQLSWLEGELQHSQNRTWIFQGSQFFGDFKAESGTYAHIAPEEIKHFAKLVNSHNKETFFGSGDVHFSEICRAPRELIGFDAVEITSSCLHSFIQKKLPQKESRIAGALKENFIFLDITSAGSAKATCIGRGNKEHFKLAIN